ncbi:MAG: tRNA lysidine(34) synthetase TilS [Myxococcales bacterium]|nr:tRNA lysidine(34) synthetase TilS [Myxococcales bacterium]MCB9519459.1 tRNA lysidine(34) synthetase TilS [Myxococcales bacterium]MCB9530807.1 tRNA lysidine(34) synthetase TilS [Myxococcales bacterium]
MSNPLTGSSRANFTRDLRRLDALRRDTVRDLARETSIVVALSGGPDSSALAALCSESGVAWRAVHVHHGLHAAADVAARRAEELAAELGARCDVVAVDAGEILAHPGGVEAGAREHRYAALARASHAGESVATGHTASDRLETTLLRLCQGAGLSGATGPRERIVMHGATFVRPLLRWWRRDIVALVAALGIEPSADPMNEDPRFARVAIRTRVAAPLVELAAPSSLLRSLEGLARDGEALRWLADREVDRIARPVGAELFVGASALSRLPTEVRAAVVVALARRLDARPTARFVEAVCAPLPERPPTAHTAGLRAEWLSSHLRFARTDDERCVLPSLGWSAPVEPERPVATPLGDLVLREVGAADAPLVSARLAALDEPPPLVIDPLAITGPLQVRGARADDAMIVRGRAVPLLARLKRDGFDARSRAATLVLADDDGPLAVLGGRRGERARALAGVGWAVEWRSS